MTGPSFSSGYQDPVNGRMAQDNEVTALRAAGMNVLTAMRLPLIAAGLIAVGLTLFNNHILPETNHAFANLMIDVAKKRPAIESIWSLNFL